MNMKFLQEAKELELKWKQSGLLDKLDRAVKLMECQRLHNETGTWDCCDECREREKKSGN